MADVPMRVINDPFEGWVLVLGGGHPLVARVLGPKAGSVTEYDRRLLLDLGEYHEAKRPWPEAVPVGLRLYQKVLILGCARAFRPVDVLWASFGASQYGTADEGYWLWQEAAGTMTRLAALQVRAALASPWVRLWREEVQAERAIRLRV